MKIVITDGYTLNPGNQGWQPLQELGDVFYYDRSSINDTIARCHDADIIICNKTIINKMLLDTATNLKLIAVTATGFDNIDKAAAKEKNITICNVPEYGSLEVAQHTIALLLQLTNHVGINANSVHNGGWQQQQDWCYSLQPIQSLQNKVLGIVGMGKIGNQVARIAEALGMQIIFHGGQSKFGIGTAVNQYQLFLQSDIVSLHCPLNKENTGFVNTELIELMKPTAILINTARGALINEKDLARALYQQRISAAALDVLATEPPGKDHPLIGLRNCLITPHTAWLAKAARERILATTIANVKSFLDYQPINTVIL
jgi:glycerate dehydrogenase